MSVRLLRQDQEGKGTVLYEIETYKGPQYMRVDGGAGAMDDRMVVIVDSSLFLRLWNLKEGLSSPSRWKSAPGYAEVQSRFLSGMRHPLRLAQIEIRWSFLTSILTRLLGLLRLNLTLPGKRLKIVEGERRTMWLLANGADAFPVECSASCAPLLHRLAGVESIPPAPLKDIVTPPADRSPVSEQG